MNNRYQRFVERRKEEGKKRKSLWCTDLEWKVLSSLKDRLELMDIEACTPIEKGSLLVNLRRDICKVPYGGIVKFLSFYSSTFLRFKYGSGVSEICGLGSVNNFKLVNFK